MQADVRLASRFLRSGASGQSPTRRRIAFGRFSHGGFYSIRSFVLVGGIWEELARLNWQLHCPNASLGGVTP